MITVRPVARRDADAWRKLRCALWPDGSASEHQHEIESFLVGIASEPKAVLLAENMEGSVVGLAELSIRPCAEGRRTSRAAYLEGWFVAPEARRQGVGRALLKAAEEWGRTQGCTEFASDTQPDNVISTTAHHALGFAEVGLVRCFRKEI